MSHSPAGAFCVSAQETGELEAPSGPPPIIAPVPSQNQVDAVGVVSQDSIARRIWDQHRRASRARRQLELIWEMLLLHIDGAGDAQWATIYEGTRVEIPRFLSEYRKTENVLRPIVRNAVAYHTTVPLRYFAESSADQRSRERAIIDTLWANHLAYEQDFNGLFSQAMSLAMACGFCPTHGFWREDTKGSWFEATAPEGAAPMRPPMPGSLDCFVGNPWDTIFEPGARRGSWRWMSYLRVLPADAVRKFFDHIPQARSLEGTTRLSATSEFQRIARNWLTGSLGVHGRPLIERDRAGTKDDESITLLFREEAPSGPDDPGKLYIVGLPGYADRRDGNDGATTPVLMASQALPGGDYSAGIFYSDERGTDVHGKPWAEPLDQLQVDLNLTLSYEWEHGRKQAEAPIVAPGGAFHDDMMELGGYNVVEVEPSLANWRPRVMEWPQSVLTWLQSKQGSLRSQLFTLGGYQAVSRGEAPGSRTPYRAILALQQADRTIHGPVNMWFQRSGIEFMRRMWMQFKTYGDIPWLLSVVGDEYGYLVDPYVDKTKLSDTPPRYRLVNSFGASPELLAQEVVQLAQTRGADGQPFLTTEEARRAYPYRLYFDQPGDPKAVQRRRARTVAAHAHVLASRYRQATGFDDSALPPQWRQQAVEQIGQQLAFVGIVLPDETGQGQVVEEGLDQRFPRLRDDDIEAHLAAYTEVTQDETADPLARAALRARQQSYFEWQQQMVMQAQQAQLQAQMQAQGAQAAQGGAPGAASELAAGRSAVVNNQRSGSAAVAAAPGA